MRGDTSPLARAVLRGPGRAALAGFLLLAGGAPIGAQVTAVAAAHIPLPAVATRASRQQPLYFEANVGQTEPSVRFLAHGRGYTLFLTDQGAVFRLASTGRQGGAAVRLSLVGARTHCAGRRGATAGAGQLFPGPRPPYQYPHLCPCTLQGSLPRYRRGVLQPWRATGV